MNLSYRWLHEAVILRSLRRFLSLLLLAASLVGSLNPFNPRALLLGSSSAPQKFINVPSTKSVWTNMSSLPFITKLEGIGGQIKAHPSQFRVIEVTDESAGYVPVEESNLKNLGKHVYVTLTRESMTTRDVVDLLAHTFAVRADDIGYAGLKDRNAICTQTFSLPRDSLPQEFRMPDGLKAIAARCISEGLVVEGLPRLHQSKLRTGQLRSNYFEIVVSDTVMEPKKAIVQAGLIADALKATGWANFFGPQRFGKSGPEGTLVQERAYLAKLVARGCKLRYQPWLVHLKLQALQSVLFNAYLATRINAGKFGALLPGDVVCLLNMSSVQKTWLTVSPYLDADKARDVSVPEQDAAAFSAGDVSFTGPLYGKGMRKPSSIAADVEQSVWEALMPELPLSSVKMGGSRRVGRLPVPADLEICECPTANGLLFRFTLPSGSYATSFLREFIGHDGACALGEMDQVEPKHEMEQVEAEQDRFPARALDRKEAWTMAGTVGLRFTCVPKDRRKATKQCIEMLEALSDRAGEYFLAPTAIDSLMFLCSSSAMPDEPVRLAMRALEQALRTGSSPAPLVERLLPVQAVCPANSDDILEVLANLLREFGASEDGAGSYRVEIKQRGSVRIDRHAIIRSIASLLAEILPLATLDLGGGDTAITIDIFRGTACIAVLPDWHRLQRYTLSRAVAAVTPNLQHQ